MQPLEHTRAHCHVTIQSLTCISSLSTSSTARSAVTSAFSRSICCTVAVANDVTCCSQVMPALVCVLPLA